MQGFKLAVRRTYFGSAWSLVAWASVAWVTLVNWPAWWIAVVVAVSWPVGVWATTKLNEERGRAAVAAEKAAKVGRS
jgi:hypothetical protein